jgi:hypothetical protein
MEFDFPAALPYGGAGKQQGAPPAALQEMLERRGIHLHFFDGYVIMVSF